MRISDSSTIESTLLPSICFHKSEVSGLAMTRSSVAIYLLPLPKKDGSEVLKYFETASEQQNGLADQMIHAC
jgi:hypothetical protein